MSANRKKTRKVGPIGIAKSDKQKQPRVPSSGARPKKRKGLASGSRNNVEKKSKPISSGEQHNKDPRLGSKKPVALIVDTAKIKQAEKTFYSPQQELKYIEQDTRLNKLLDKEENALALSIEEQAYMDKKMARHQALCAMLGIADDAQGIQESDTSDELLNQFDQIDPAFVGKF